MKIILHIGQADASTNMIQDTCLIGNGSTQNEKRHTEAEQRSLKRGRTTTSDSHHSSRRDWRSHPLAENMVESVWRGGFIVDDEAFEVGNLEGHLSGKACIDVCELACSLSSLLHLEKLPLLHPERLPSLMPFPTVENVHLFLTSETGRQNEDLDNLIDAMVQQNLAMKATTSEVDLFLFTSHKLPDEYQRKNGKHYLWAMLRGKLDAHAKKCDPGSQCEPYHTDTLARGLEIVETSRSSPDCLTETGGVCSPKVFAETVEERGPAIVEEAQDALLVTTSDGSQEGEGSYNPDPTSNDSIGGSLLHVVSALDDSAGFDEADTANDSDEQVGHYYVKPSLAPVLRCIIEKHGDIARDCPLFSRSMLTSTLERICIIVHDLQGIPFTHIQLHHLESMNHAILDGEVVKMDMKWLRRRYDELWENVDHVKYYKDVLQTIADTAEITANREKSLEQKRAELEKLKAEILLLENHLGSLKEKSLTLNSSAREAATVCKQFQRQCLMDGLL